MISEKDGQLIVSGAMNQQTAAALLPAGEELVCSADRVINLAGIDSVDSSALAVLLGWMRAAKAAGKQIRIVEAPAAFISLANLYGVNAILFPTGTGSDHSAQH